MKTKPQVTATTWTAQAATLVAGLAILLALPTSAMLITILAGAMAAGIGIAELRRHGGPGVPALPYALGD